jgi:hypothetical protein
MVGLIVELKEILHNPDQSLNLDLNAKLLSHLSLQGFCAGLQQLNPASRKRPEIIHLGSVKENAIAVQGNAHNSIVKPAIPYLEIDHDRHP